MGHRGPTDRAAAAVFLERSWEVARPLEFVGGVWRPDKHTGWTPRLVVADGRRWAVTDRSASAIRSLRDALDDFVGGCSEADLRTGDLPRRQRVAHYDSAANQRRYAHMYAGRQFACWRALRAVLRWRGLADRQVWSIGTGPGADVMGWCVDRPRNGGVHAVDPVRWDVVHLGPWRKAFDLLIRDCEWHIGRCLGGRSFAPQLSGRTVRPLHASEIPDGSVVLLSFVLNHFLDERGRIPPSTASVLARWLRDLASRDARIVIVDMGHDETWLWKDLLPVMGLERLRRHTFCFDRVLEPLSVLYPDELAAYRTGRRIAKFATVRALAFDGGRWSFVGGGR